MTGTKQRGQRLSGTNLERAADHNQRITLHAIRVNHSLTRVDLANITGLTPPAIANITRRLLDDDLIRDAGQRRGGRGQPPTKLVINPDACWSIGVNIDRDHITIVIVNFIGETLARVSREVQFALPDEVRAMWRESIGGLIKAAGIDAARIVGIGVASPDDLGRVDLPGRPHAYGEWDTTDVPALFAEPLDLPVFVENDAAAAAMGELQLGHGQRYSSFFYILISSGLGGGLVIDGAYFRGENGRSGEIGFLTAGSDRNAHNQVQYSVSLSGLGRMLQQAGFALSDMLHVEDRGPEVEAVVEKWIAEAVAHLSEPLIAVNCLINPAAVFIGGRLAAADVDRIASGLVDHLGATADNVPFVAPVKRAMLSADAPAVGAAILPFSHFLLPKPNALWKANSAAVHAQSDPIML
jgi:predicted NBD/HSP70 family sugar kinase